MLKLKNNKSLRKLTSFATSFFFVLILSMLCACGEKKETKKPVPVAQPAVEKKEEATVDAGANEEVAYDYIAEGKRDPFKPFLKKKETTKIEQKSPLTPLQKYEISQLKLTGVVSGKDANTSRAMVEDPAGRGYILKIGTLIGKNFGKVSGIMPNSVIVTEEIQDMLGNILTKEIPLTLESEEGE